MSTSSIYTAPPAGALAFTIGETAFLLRSKRDKVYSLISSGTLKPVKVGGRTLFPRATVESYLASIGLMEAAHV